MSRFKTTTIDLTQTTVRPYIPGRSSPRSGQRACLCWGTGTYNATYSRKCCTGDIHAQAIGFIGPYVSPFGISAFSSGFKQSSFS